MLLFLEAMCTKVLLLLIFEGDVLTLFLFVKQISHRRLQVLQLKLVLNQQVRQMSLMANMLLFLIIFKSQKL